MTADPADTSMLMFAPAARCETTSSDPVRTPSPIVNGTPVWVEFYSPLVTHSVSATGVLVDIWNDSTALGVAAEFPAPTASGGQYARAARLVTPTAGLHVFTARGWASGAGTITPGPGNGGAREAYPRHPENNKG